LNAVTEVTERRVAFINFVGRLVDAAAQAECALSEAQAASRNETHVFFCSPQSVAAQASLELLQPEIFDLRESWGSYDSESPVTALIDLADSVVSHSLTTFYLGTFEDSLATQGRSASSVRQLKALTKAAQQTSAMLAPLPSGVVRLTARQ